MKGLCKIYARFIQDLHRSNKRYSFACVITDVRAHRLTPPFNHLPLIDYKLFTHPHLKRLKGKGTQQ